MARTLQILLHGAAIALLCAVVQLSPALLGLIAREDIHFRNDSPSSLSAQLNSLKPGRYYLSAGRVLAPTTVHVQQQLIQSDPLAIGTDITVGSSSESIELKIAWKSGEEWRSRLFDFPIITQPGIGRIIQTWRVFNATFLGSVFSILLLFLTAINSSISKQARTKAIPHFILAITALAYSASLSGILELFSTPSTITLIQLLLRIGLSASFLVLTENYSKQSSILLYAHIPCGAWILITHALNPPAILSAYRWQLAIFASLTALTAKQLIQSKQNAFETNLFSKVIVAWTILQTASALIYYTYGPSFMTVLSPSIIAALACVDFYLIYRRTVELTAEIEVSKTLTLLAGQVAHDIRSPLAALKVSISRTNELDTAQLKLITTAIQRIETIANQVLYQYAAKLHNPRPPRILSLVNCAESIAAEKAIEWNNTRSIVSKISHRSNEVSAYFDELSLKNVLSNILNNAHQAAPANTDITLRIRTTDTEAVIEIQNNGPVIPRDRLSAFRSMASSPRTITHKSFGLPNAYRTIHSWGGHLEISSNEQDGTTVSIYLLKTSPTPQNPSQD